MSKNITFVRYDCGRPLAKVSKYYREDGTDGGFNCDADAIRAVLRHTQHFDEDEIAAWPDSDHIIVPNGTSLYPFIVRRVKSEGLAYKVIAKRMPNAAVRTWDHYGEFDEGALCEGEWFSWERNGISIEKECVSSYGPCQRP
jgi:hypothetical protein